MIGKHARGVVHVVVCYDSGFAVTAPNMAHNDSYDQHDDDVELVSKSQMKREMTALQDLGAELIPLDIKLLEPLGLPERLVAAIREAKRLKAHGAIARHKQYIGKLMREVDPEPIRALLARIAGQSDEHNAWLHKLERLREKMLTEPKAVEAFVAEHPAVDVQHLRQLIRNAVKEREQQKPPKAFRELFQLLKEQFAQPVQPNPDGTLPESDEE
ncbi:hypothetical protein GCM10010971_32280 [Silvimonas amylolytica]|uniref:Dual-action ribosomal maturation protein DarP n=2 Tax=Silvimonas amylolytica TaxID=449663 RepID=A0ABQ2PP69_9NEIS|nr:hypothetical protein GCM10010971_32280 [Silvimonas amylolytica]